MNTISPVDGLLAQMRTMRAIATSGSQESGALGQMGAPTQAGGMNQSGKVDFSNVLKSSLDGVARAQEKSDSLQQAFVMGDDKVSLSDTMIAMQKASINLQTTVQVRNRFVQAYNDIMNMQV